jgi:hypothetical protein
MPNFQGQLSEENVIQLIAYIKSLASTAPPSQTGTNPPAGTGVPPAIRKPKTILKEQAPIAAVRAPQQ